MRIASVGKAFPPHYYDQDALLEALRRVWSKRFFNQDRLDSLHRNVLVGGRHLALPLEEYEQRVTSWGAANDAWIEVSQEIGAAAIGDAIDKAGLSLADIGCLIFVSVTGVATPSIDARLMNRLDLPSGVRRVPIFGLGCVAGAAGIARAADYTKAYPDQVAVLLSVELCSLTLQLQDLSIPNLISSGLFGDGAAAAVVSRNAPAEGRAIEWIASATHMIPEDREALRFQHESGLLRNVLAPEVPDIAAVHARNVFDEVSRETGISSDQITSWLWHAGGKNVLHALREAFGLEEEDVGISRELLGHLGNVSSPFVLFALAEARKRDLPNGLWWMASFGAGFSSHGALLRAA